jgi:hypothetical protein
MPNNLYFFYIFIGYKSLIFKHLYIYIFIMQKDFFLLFFTFYNNHFFAYNYRKKCIFKDDLRATYYEDTN